MQKYNIYKCKKCGKEPTRIGTYVNMILSNMDSPLEFNNCYGIMCAEHAEEVMEQIIKEKNITLADIEKAHIQALQKMDNEIGHL